MIFLPAPTTLSTEQPSKNTTIRHSPVKPPSQSIAPTSSTRSLLAVTGSIRTRHRTHCECRPGFRFNPNIMFCRGEFDKFFSCFTAVDCLGTKISF